MVILIAHRGNLNGPNPEKENHPDYVARALALGFHAEIDVWFFDGPEGSTGRWFLGHDAPQYEISIDFLKNPHLWCHAKNLPALDRMLREPRIHCFWHQNDDCTLTSEGYVWTYPGKLPTRYSICVMPELAGDAGKLAAWVGVCSDYVEKYR